MVLAGFNFMLALRCPFIWELADGDGLVHIFQLAGSVNRGTSVLFCVASPAESLDFLHDNGSIAREEASMWKQL